MEFLTDQEVRSSIKFSGMFGDKTYAQLTPIYELRQKLEWLYKTHPDTIPEYQRSKIITHVRSTEPIMNKECTKNIISIAVTCTIIVYGILLLKYVIDILIIIGIFIKFYGYILIGILFIGFKLYSVKKTSHFINISKYISEKNSYKKQPISSTLKRKVWDTHIGQTIGQHKCFCCNLTYITQLSFHCGHVIPESKGGDTKLSNLRPICQNCNSSMGTQNMYDFMKTFH